jgi:predicted DNA-binding protein
MLGMLGMPYPEDMAEGMMTVTSVKIPKPIWERLEYARTLTKKDKQDIIAEALRLYFDRIVEGIGE